MNRTCLAVFCVALLLNEAGVAQDTTGRLLQISRDLIRQNDTTFIVTLAFDASIISGELRVTENVQVPGRCTARVNSGAEVVTKRSQISFQWKELSNTGQVYLEYLLECEQPAPDANPEILNTLYFRGKDLPYAVTNTPDKHSSIADQEKGSEMSSETDSTGSMTAAVPRKRRSDAISFSVQIVCGQSALSADEIAGAYSFNEPLVMELRSDRIVYMSGIHSTYAGAKAACEKMKTAYPRLPGPFVVAYRNGRRIDVKEAISLSSE